MKILATCLKCAEENKLTEQDPYSYVQYNEKMSTYVCNNGHKNNFKILKNKFELLYDSAIISFYDSYYREAVMNLYSCLENFQEYVIKILLYSIKKLQYNEIESYLKRIKSRSECREGCFYSICKIYLDKDYFIDDKYKSLRNQVVHNGIFPDKRQTQNFAKYTFNFICNCYRDIIKILDKKSKCKFQSFSAEWINKDLINKCELTIITTMLINGFHGVDFEDELKRFKSSIRDNYKSNNINKLSLDKLQNIIFEEII